MKDVVVIGTGKIGATVAGLLATTEDYQVTLADRSADVLDRLDANNAYALLSWMSRTARISSICSMGSLPCSMQGRSI
jgi:saccharopine dehydrogenase-like NADP-dependent oxidoreductase